MYCPSCHQNAGHRCIPPSLRFQHDLKTLQVAQSSQAQELRQMFRKTDA